MSKLVSLVLALAAGALMAGQAHAGLNNWRVEYSNPVGRGGATADYSYPINEQSVTYGVPLHDDDPQDRISFIGALVQPFAPEAQFILGKLTLANYPVVTNSGISYIGFNLRATVLTFPDDDTYLNDAGPFHFGLSIDETPNGRFRADCPYFSTVPCSDRLSLAFGETIDTLEYNGAIYTLFIDGFRDIGPDDEPVGPLVDGFIAQERQENAVYVIGRFSVDAGTPGGPPPSPDSSVPEPASWALLLVGFAVAGGGLRWRRRLLLG